MSNAWDELWRSHLDTARRTYSMTPHADGVFGQLNEDVASAGLALLIGGFEDPEAGMLTVVVALDDGDPAPDWMLDGVETLVSARVASTTRRQIVSGSRDEALDPETPAERLRLLATVFADEVRENPAFPLLRMAHPGFFDHIE